MLKTLTGLSLIAHGLVHWVLVAPHPDVAGSGFAGFLKHSWLVTRAGLDESTAYLIGMALLAIVSIGFTVAGIPVFASQAWWRPLAIAMAGISIVLLALFWHKWLVVGPVLDMAILVSLIFFKWPSASTIGS